MTRPTHPLQIGPKLSVKLPAGSAINAFAQEVRVTVVVGVFPDHVQVNPPQRHLAPAIARERGIEWRISNCPAAGVPIAGARQTI